MRRESKGHAKRPPAPYVERVPVRLSTRSDWKPTSCRFPRHPLPRLLTAQLPAPATARVARSESYGINGAHANDQGQRWQQIRYVLRGVDPTAIPSVIRGDVAGFKQQEYAEAGAPHAPAHENKRVHPVGDHPPWSYAPGRAAARVR